MLDIVNQLQLQHDLDTMFSKTSNKFGQLFFEALVEYLSEALQVQIAFIFELDESLKGQVCLLALWEGNDEDENLFESLPPKDKGEFNLKKTFQTVLIKNIINDKSRFLVYHLLTSNLFVKPTRRILSSIINLATYTE